MCVREGVCWGAKWSHERKWESLIPQLHNADWKRRQDRASGSVCGGCGSGRVRGAQPGLRGKDS